MKIGELVGLLRQYDSEQDCWLALHKFGASGDLVTTGNAVIAKQITVYDGFHPVVAQTDGDCCKKCGQKITPFRDESSAYEWTYTGECQNCQDKEYERPWVKE